MPSPFNSAGLFLIQTIFGLYLFILMLRIILQFNRAEFHNPVSQFVVKLTNPLVMPLRKFIPSYPRIDLAVVLVLLILDMFKLLAVAWIALDGVPNPLGLLIWSLGDLSRILINILFYAVIISVVLSWLMPTLQNPLSSIVHRITGPLLAMARRMIPPVSGFDLSPLVVIIGLKLTEILLAGPLIKVGTKLAFI